MNNELQALPVEDGQDPLNSYHEIVRRALSATYGVPDLYDCLRDEVKDVLRQTAKEALSGNNDPIPAGPLFDMRVEVAQWVFYNIDPLEA